MVLLFFFVRVSFQGFRKEGGGIVKISTMNRQKKKRKKHTLEKGSRNSLRKRLIMHVK